MIHVFHAAGNTDFISDDNVSADGSYVQERKSAMKLLVQLFLIFAKIFRLVAF